MSDYIELLTSALPLLRMALEHRRQLRSEDPAGASNPGPTAPSRGPSLRPRPGATRYRVRMGDEVEQAGKHDLTTRAGAPALASRAMNESRIAVAGLLQLHAMQAGADFERSIALSLEVLAAHQGEVRSWDNFQGMIVEVRLAAGIERERG